MKKTWTDSPVAKALNLSFPIIQGPFGRGGSTALLAATVSNAGGLGSFGANDLAPENICKTAAEIRQLTEKPFGMNLWVSTFDAGGETLDEETYDRVLKLLAPYYRELGVEPPERPVGAVADFDETGRSVDRSQAGSVQLRLRHSLTANPSSLQGKGNHHRGRGVHGG